MESLISYIGEGMTVEVESRFSPPVTIAVDSPTSPIWEIIKPKITVKRNGQTIVTHAPFGEPGTNLFLPLMLIGLVITVILVTR